MKNTIHKEFKNFHVYLQDAIIKVIIKQKIIGKKAHLEEGQTTIINDRFFTSFIAKFNKILNLLTP